MNNTFQPPPPLTRSERLELYLEYMKDPTPLRLHMLAERHKISLRRFDALVRLTHLEQSWPKVRLIIIFILRLSRTTVMSLSISLEDIPHG